MKKMFVLFISTFLVFQVNSQEKCQLQGKILNEDGEGLSFATIELSSLQDNACKGFTSNINGFFCITGITEGQFQIKVSFVGYELFISDIFTLNKGEDVNFGKIILKNGNLLLSEVSIIGYSKKKITWFRGAY